MNEADWLTCEDPQAMLQHLRETRRIHRSPGGRRKLRLFLCACFRRLQSLLPDPRTWAAIELGERLADGFFDAESIHRADLQAVEAAREGKEIAQVRPGGLRTSSAMALLAAEVRLCLEPQPWLAVQNASARLNALARCDREIASQTGPAIRSELLREIIGNPFSPAVPDVAWLEWNGGVVWKIARTIHDEYRFEELPVLADALEDAGCADPDILGHCRGGGLHARGCWVADLLLGRW